MASERCSKRMGVLGMLQCSRKGVVSEESRWWCKQHAPSNAKARNDGRISKWNAERDADKAVAAKAANLAGIERRIIAAAWDYNDLNIADDREILDRLSALVSEYRAAGGSRPS